MADHTINIDVIDLSVPELNPINIAIINLPNPVKGYSANAKEVKDLIQIPRYSIFEAGTSKLINGRNYYEYFPEEGGGGGITPEEVQALIRASIDSSISESSTNAIQNSTITNFVNSSIETSTAEFKGTFETKAAMDAVTGNKNDYAFLVVKNNDQTVNHYERYKWVDTPVDNSNWVFEYNLNNSSFTAEQWAAINSGIKSTDVSQINTNKNDIITINQTIGDINDALEEVL